jgi:hypothetical protein
VEAKGSEGTKKRKLGKKERAKLKAAALSKATSPSNDA